MGYRSTSLYGQNAQVASAFSSNEITHFNPDPTIDESVSWFSQLNSMDTYSNIELLPSYRPNANRIFDAIWHRCPVRSLCNSFKPESTLTPPLPVLWKNSQHVIGISWKLHW